MEVQYQVLVRHHQFLKHFCGFYTGSQVSLSILSRLKERRQEEQGCCYFTFFIHQKIN